MSGAENSPENFQKYRYKYKINYSLPYEKGTFKLRFIRDIYARDSFTAVHISTNEWSEFGCGGRELIDSAFGPLPRLTINCNGVVTFGVAFVL